MAELMGLAARHPGRMETFNAAAPEITSFNAMAKVVRRLAGASGPRDRTPDPRELWRRYVLPLDVSKARRELGFVARVPVAEGLAEMVAAAGCARRSRARPVTLRRC